MRADEIEFVKLVGIEQSGDSVSLAYKKDVQSHINTIHASAQFTLAETQSGLYLQTLFPELEGKVIPLLRESSMKYKKPALKDITAFASVKDEDKEKFLELFERKGRASLSVAVEVKDSDGVCTAQGTFGWFISKI
ncbi:YiiD C-terminal domain-containing protein [Sulfurimonas sp. SAG-AH-194-C20]|nr:YiiD C-terminal domain-containing protein [Sulfurimonas sp. SAG-AH-194-C20]MDF1878315.1 YiiD C-terminal domain-containing protein [Sulfurimonas sp. SAG-AH-194-C20]